MGGRRPGHGVVLSDLWTLRRSAPEAARRCAPTEGLRRHPRRRRPRGVDRAARHQPRAGPRRVGLDEAAIAADAIATPYHVFTERARVRPGRTIAVIGAGGGVGVHMAGMAQAFGAEVVAVERDAAKEKRLADHNFDVVWNPGDDPHWGRPSLPNWAARSTSASTRWPPPPR